MAKKIETKEIVNTYTGEVTNITKYGNLKLDPSMQFVFLFTEQIGKLQGLSGKTWEVLFSLVKNASYNNTVYVNADMKREAKSMFQVATSTIDKAITDLVKKEILIRKARGTYLLNPKFFGKGSLHKIKKLRLINEIDFYNRKIKFGSEYEYMTEEEIEHLELKDLEIKVSEAKNKIAQVKHK